MLKKIFLVLLITVFAAGISFSQDKVQDAKKKEIVQVKESDDIKCDKSMSEKSCCKEVKAADKCKADKKESEHKSDCCKGMEKAEASKVEKKECTEHSEKN